MSEQVAFRPHARLLTMLGEQLIKSDQIALVELVKNSYDADATHVWVDFVGFGSNFETTAESSIAILDDGTGMSFETVRDDWMSPATPVKLNRKRSNAITKAGRTLQGEKGIGRFAAFKLGSHVELTTREDQASQESVLEVDISALDEEAEWIKAVNGALTAPKPNEGSSRDLYLDQFRAIVLQRQPTTFTGDWKPPRGTRLKVSKLRARWSYDKVTRAFADLARLQPVMWGGALSGSTSSNLAPDEVAGFQVIFLKDGKDLRLVEGQDEHFQSVLERAVLRVREGRVDIESRTVTFDLNGRPTRLSLDGPEIRGLRPFRERFLRVEPDAEPAFECGSFGFEFFVFDFSRLAPSEHQLDDGDKKLLREHRIYLYRDGVRVYPYGDPDDDWLQIDVLRGTQSARSMFSNDQTVGFVAITQAENPRLQDKTNREGLLDLGPSTGDFIALIQSVLAYLRSKPYEQYSAANRRAHEHRRPPREAVDENIQRLKGIDLPGDATKAIEGLEAAVAAEREVAQLQIARTQDLAGVGLSVETASHDLIAAGSESLRLARLIITELKRLGHAGEHVFDLTTSLVQRLEFVDSRFQDVQGLFVSTRQKRGAVDVLQQARKVRSMYAALHAARGITFEIAENARLRAETTESAVLQALINLVDNATYWLLATKQESPRVIRAFVTAPDTFVISDSGPGIHAADEPFIFEPFYSGKGDAGKGLGLYIARQVGARNGFSVDLEQKQEERMLEGAAFSLKFSEVLS
jgi:signal transduction histidine kinase